MLLSCIFFRSWWLSMRTTQKKLEESAHQHSSASQQLNKSQVLDLQTIPSPWSPQVSWILPRAKLYRITISYHIITTTLLRYLLLTGLHFLCLPKETPVLVVRLNRDLSALQPNEVAVSYSECNWTSFGDGSFCQPTRKQGPTRHQFYTSFKDLQGLINNPLETYWNHARSRSSYTFITLRTIQKYSHHL